MMPSSSFPAPVGAPSFTLTEVLISLTIVAFTMTAILGLFSVGLRTDQDSAGQLQAAHVADILATTRRATPTNAISAFPIPPLAPGLSNTVTIGADGTTRSDAVYRLLYAANTNAATGPKLMNLYLLLWWPAAAAHPPTNSSGNYYELSTQIHMP